MVIVSAADDNFVAHFATMLHSAWFHNKAAQFYFLDCGISKESRERLDRLSAQNGIDLTIVAVDTKRLAGLPLASHLSPAAYAPLLIPELLPRPLDKILFLDADCVVVADLGDLWRLDITNCLVAAARDPEGWGAERRRGNFQDSAVYVNSGVMLINLHAWRELDAYKSALEFLRTHAAPWADQSAINFFCKDRIEVISDDWNLRVSKIERARLSATSPKIVHYTGTVKPWRHWLAPLGGIYRHHRQRTPFPLDERRLRASRLRSMLCLTILRPKYWRLLIFSIANDRLMTKPYLRSLEANGGSGHKHPRDVQHQA